MKQTTASQWLRDHPGDVEALEGMLAGADVPIGVWTDLPAWMKAGIAEQLEDTFSQPYWAKVHETTKGDAERYVRKGLDEGWSIRKIAGKMRHHFIDPDDPKGTLRYARQRSENIARTESGHGLNGARKMSMDQLAEDLGPDVAEMIRPSWLSVLGNTTRDAHANLDGVPADENGMWNLAGYLVPWPGHVSLPPEERCSCQCTITTEFGMDEGTARGLIQEYEERVGIEAPEEDIVVTPPSKMGSEDLFKYMDGLIEEDKARLAHDRPIQKRLAKELEEATAARAAVDIPADPEAVKKAEHEWFDAFAQAKSAEEKNAAQARYQELKARRKDPEAFRTAEVEYKRRAEAFRKFDEEAKARNTAKKRALEAIKLEEEDRSSVGITASGFSKKAEKMIRKSVREFEEIVSKDTIGEFQGVAINRTKSSRASYASGEVLLGSGGSRGKKSVVHELGHWIEDINKGAGSRARKFLNDKTRGADRVWLGKGYRKDEEYKPRTDGVKWIDNYMGKMYEHKATEITSMGLELYATNPMKLATKDPDLFRFIAFVVRGK